MTAIQNRSTVVELLGFVAAAFVLAYAAVAQPLLLALGLAVGATIAAVVLSLLSIEWAWCVYFLALCANGVQATVAGFTVRPEYFAVPLFVVALLTHIRRTPGAVTQVPVHPGIYVGAIGFVAVAIGSSLLLAPDPGTSLRMSVQVVLALASIVPLVLVKLDIRFVLLSGTAILSAICIVSIGYFLVDTSRRLSGLAFEYNVMGALCIGWIALLYYFAGRESDGTASLVDTRVMFLAVPIVVALILTSTRAAWVAGLILFGYWAVQNFTKRPIFVSASMLGGVLAFGVLQEIYDRVGDDDTFLWRLVHVVDTETGTGAYRVQIWNDAIAQILVRDWTAVIGTGFNSFTQFNPVDPTNVTAAYLSSMWLAIVYDTGFLGSAFFVVLIISLFLAVTNKKRALPLFVALAVCTSVTSILWFAFPWAFLALAVNGSLPPPSLGSTTRRLARRHRRRLVRT